jgi:signal transduction histidine kinase
MVSSDDRTLFVDESSDVGVLLDMLLASSPVGICFFDQDLRYLRISPSLAKMNRRSVEEHLGRLLDEMVPHLAAIVRPLLLHVLSTGETINEHELSGPQPDFPDKTGYWLVSYFPVRSQSGQIVAVGAVVTEVTALKTTEAVVTAREKALREQASILAKVNGIGALLSAELDQQKLVQSLTDAATSIVGARFGAFHFNHIELTSHRQAETSKPYALSGISHAAFAELSGFCDAVCRASNLHVEGTIRIGNIHQELPVGYDGLRAAAGNLGPSFAETSLQSYMAVPVVSRSGDILGRLFFGHEAIDAFGEQEKQLIGGLVAQAAIALDNARLFQNVQEERAAAERANQQLSFLADASAILTSSLDYEETVQRVAHLAVPHFADWCLVDLAEPDGSLHRLAVAHHNPEHAAVARAMKRRYPSKLNSKRGTSHVLETGTADLVAAVDNEILLDLARDEEHHRALCGLEMTSYLSVPLKIHNRIIGVLTFASCGDNRSYSESDLAFASELASRAAGAIDNARLHLETQKARANAEQALRAAQEATRAKDEFLAILSHELRTPLTSGLGWMHLLRDEKLDSETRGYALEAIERAMRTQSHLVNDLLDVSGIINGRFHLQMQRVPLAQVIERAAEAVRPTAQAKDITLTVELAEAQALVNGDAERLQQLVWNILSNAVKFTPASGTVSVRMQADKEHVTFQVWDNGVGIAPDFLPYVWGRFRQAEPSTTRSHGGLGLGLSIVAHLVEMHGGTVRAESEGANRGAIFTVRLPRVPEEFSFDSFI